MTRRTVVAIGLAAVVFAAGAVGWQGANSPHSSWFGQMVSHGARRDQVALTFDDGPNVRFTPLVASILDQHGVKGTFFTVGRALDARPDISRALVRAGHLVANHSYRHDARGWLDPRYPELAQTQRSFARQLGVCPTFYRPPHGQHTPLLARVVMRHHMTMVGWEASGGDWNASDPAVVVRRVLARTHPGSIINLHDGLDGDLTADRSVLVRALPGILDGLARRGLHPVRLDVLLGVNGYAGDCAVA